MKQAITLSIMIISKLHLIKMCFLTQLDEWEHKFAIILLCDEKINKGIWQQV